MRLLPLAALALAAAVLIAAGAHEHVGLAAVMERREELRTFVATRPLLAVLGYMGLYVAFVALSLPGAWWLSVMGGFLFGWVVGGALAVVSATVGAILIFLAARTSVGESIVLRLGPRLTRFLAAFRRNAFSYLLIMRLLPVIPFWVNNLAPALVGARLSSFASATFLGIIPVTFAFAVAGEGLDATMAREAAQVAACREAGAGACLPSLALSDLVTPQLVAAIAVISLLSVLPVLFRRRLGLVRPADEA
ncbi:MAG TPA: VTT domain-containing protein [Salinarimonas sp.]|nr:VTT domain-containing protein [Salinarimonas sp.]